MDNNNTNSKENKTNDNQPSENKSGNSFRDALKRQKVAPGGAGALQTAQNQANEPLSFTSQTVPSVSEVVTPEPAKEGLDIVGVLQSRYKEARYQRISDEVKAVSLQALITPSMNERLMKDISKKKIKSKNDLVNFLLEEYYGLHDEKS